MCPRLSSYKDLVNPDLGVFRGETKSSLRRKAYNRLFYRGECQEKRFSLDRK